MSVVVINYLKNEFEERKKRNPSYSLRSFARNLQVSPAQLSQIISGKRPLTKKSLSKLVEKLNLSPSEKRKCWKSIVEDDYVNTEKNQIQLAEDQFRLISDWYHLAILSLASQPKAKNNSRWISEKLGITQQESQLALDRLTRLNLISGGHSLKQTSNPLNIVSDVPSEGIRRFHKQVLHLGLDKIDSVDVSKRDFSAITFSFNPHRIKELRDLIEEFQNQVLQDNTHGSDVYMMAVQLFPLTYKEQK